MKKSKKTKIELFGIVLKMFSSLFRKVFEVSYKYGYNHKKKKLKVKSVEAGKDIQLIGICQGCDNDPNNYSFDPNVCIRCKQYKTMLALQYKIQYLKPVLKMKGGLL